MSNTHFRSISLPSTCHPVSAQFDEHLSRLISSENATTSCSSISQSLSILTGLYESVDELLVLPVNQQIIAKSSQAEWVDDMLDGSLRLLDVCGVATDALLQMKESLQGVQSALRRRFSGEVSVSKGVAEYMDSRKKVKKVIRHCLKNMRKNDRVDSTATIDSVLRNVEAITADVFRSLLSHIVGSKAQSSNLVVRLMQQVSDIDQASSGSEFEDIDAQLRSLISQKKSGINTTELENLRSQMVKLESEIQELVEESEFLFRHLVKTRATLLNLLSNSIQNLVL